MATEQQLLDRAGEMRSNPIEGEKRLWWRLSNSQLGYKFGRQAVIGQVICDFFYPAKGLVVEVDGDTHDPFKDSMRDRVLASRGVATVGFTNRDIASNIEGVLSEIATFLAAQSDRWSRGPHSNPSPEGEGLDKMP